MNGGKQIQWFPGHMARTRRRIKEDLGLVDAVCEIVDARIPLSSRNPDLDEITGAKPRIILLNKSDLADAGANRAWRDYFAAANFRVMETDSKSGAGVRQFSQEIKALLADKLALYKSKGMQGRKLRVMVVGIPNVGKSSFISRLTGRTAKIEDRPGVTRASQWFSLGGGIELMDTPGVLWPKFEDESVGEKLAFTGAVKDSIMDTEELAVRLIEVLLPDYADNLRARYRAELSGGAYEILQDIAKKRGMLISGGEADTARAAVMLLDEFRAGRLGRITLELPPRAE